MGLVIDSTAFVQAERARKSVSQLTLAVGLVAPGESLIASVISLAELAHGAQRASTLSESRHRAEFIQQVLAELFIQPVTAKIALRAGRLDGTQAARGKRLAFTDLLIAATALELGYGVRTSNVRHFAPIDGLRVVTF